MILAFGLRAARVVLAHSGRCLSAVRRMSERRICLAGIGEAELIRQLPRRHAVGMG